MRFDNQVAIITGAASGLGRAYAITLAERGAKVVLIDICRAQDGECSLMGVSNKSLKETQSAIEALGAECLLFELDVASPECAIRCVEQVIAHWGRIDLLLNNAGIHKSVSFEHLSIKCWQRQLDVDLNGSFYFAKAVWPIMKCQGSGRIMMTTGASALFGDSQESAFSATKMALVGLVNSLSIEGREFDIRVNSLCPHAVTDMTRNHLAEPVKELFSMASVTSAMLFLMGPSAPSGQHLLAAAGSFSYGKFAEFQPRFFAEDNSSAERLAEAWPKMRQALPATFHHSGESQVLEWARRSAAQYHVAID